MSKSFEELVEKAKVIMKEHNTEIEKKWGTGYNSEHEFFGIVKEELEEVGENYEELKEVIEKRIWQKIRKDEGIEKSDCQLIQMLALQVIAEAIQVGAVAMRMENGIKLKEKK